MSPGSFPGAFPHQHQDPRGLDERIQAQLRERIEEAVDMAALELMVELRQRQGRPAPETSSQADRKEFAQLGAGLLGHVRDAFHAELRPGERALLEQAEAGEEDERQSLLGGQVFLSRRLPDYWQRFEAHAGAYGAARLETPASRSGWLGRLFGR
jgi:hypothetical protein